MVFMMAVTMKYAGLYVVLNSIQLLIDRVKVKPLDPCML
jgi:hypothetical protein